MTRECCATPEGSCLQINSEPVDHAKCRGKINTTRRDMTRKKDRAASA